MFASTLAISWIVMASIIILSTNLLRRRKHNHQKKPPPGPPALPVLGNLHMIGNLPHRTLQSLSTKYGPIMSLKLGLLPTVVVSSPEAAELFLKTHESIFASKPTMEASKYFQYGYKGVVFAKYGPYWRNMRKVCTFQLLSGLKVEYFGPSRKREVEGMVELVKKKRAMVVEEGGVVDVSEVVEGVLEEIVYKMVLGCSKDGDGFDLKGVVKEAMLLSGKFNVTDFVPWIGVLDVQNHGAWCLEKISHFLPDEIIQIIISHDPPHDSKPQDRLAWKLSKDGDFSSSSAYESLLIPLENHYEDVYKHIWRWRGPERGRIHLWKMAQGAIVTNMFRQKRGITPLGTCPMCELEEESLLHMVRDCRGPSQVWSALAGNCLPNNFFVSDLHSWMLGNLSCNTLIQGLEWNIIFGAAANCIWQARNGKVFRGEIVTVKSICCKALHQARAVHQNKNDSLLIAPLLNQVSHNSITWSAPSLGDWKLNCDGAVCGFGTVASAGGVLRDRNGRFILGYASALHSCNVIEAELHAIFMGLRLAGLKGFRKVEIESDSLLAVRFIKEGCSSRHPLFNLISDIQDQLCVEGDFSISHVLREANQVADSFAKFGLSLDKCSRFFSSIPSFASMAIRADFMGVSFPRGF